MTRDYLELGSAPCDEDCAQVGTPDYPERSYDECRRYIALLTTAMGEPPDGAWFSTKSFPHDFGTYREVVVYFDAANEAAADYAWRCEGEAPRTWDDTQPRSTTRPSILSQYIREEQP